MCVWPERFRCEKYKVLASWLVVWYRDSTEEGGGWLQAPRWLKIRDSKAQAYPKSCHSIFGK